MRRSAIGQGLWVGYWVVYIFRHTHHTRKCVYAPIAALSRQHSQGRNTNFVDYNGYYKVSTLEGRDANEAHRTHLIPPIIPSNAKLSYAAFLYDSAQS